MIDTMFLICAVAGVELPEYLGRMTHESKPDLPDTSADVANT